MIEDGRTTRRTFLMGAGALAATGILPTPALAARGAKNSRQLGFRNLHTGETLTARYRVDGRPDMGALADINWILRDWRTNQATQMHVGVLDFMHDLRAKLVTDAPFEIISGYRSPRTNAMLRRRGRGGVAKRSLHMRGMAVDIRLPDTDLLVLARSARAMSRGGVGYYPRSGFVHLDTGRPRKWGF